MWTAARCLAEAGDPSSIRSVRAGFRAPVLLPATVTYAADATGNAFELRGPDGRAPGGGGDEAGRGVTGAVTAPAPGG